MRNAGLGFAALAVLIAIPAYAKAAVARRAVAPVATFDSGILHVERFGQRGGRSIIFIPALFCGSWQWNAQINTFSTNDDILVVTLPGFDGRPMVAGGNLMERAAKSLHLLIATQRLNRPVVIVHSLGGTLALPTVKSS